MLSVALSTVFSVEKSIASSNFSQEDDYAKDKRFCRIKASSPLLIEFSKEIHVVNYGLSLTRKGFNIFTRKKTDDTRYGSEKEHEIGYTTYGDSQREGMSVLSLHWVYIEPEYRKKGYATEAMRTTISALQTKLPASCKACQYFCFDTSTNNTAMINIAESLGFIASTRFFNPPFMLTFEKEIFPSG